MNTPYSPILEIPNDWEDLKQNVDRYMIEEGHRRLEQEQRKYADYNRGVNRQVSLDNIKRMINKNNLMPNPFSYGLLLLNIPSVIHYLLWDNSELTQADIRDIVKERLGDFDCVSFVNHPKNQTIPELHHHHIFVNLNKGQN